MKLLVITLELMARMALFTAVMAMTLRYVGQRPRTVAVQQPSSKPTA